MENDLELIKKLEQEIGKELPLLDIDNIIGNRNNGFTADDRGRVIGLNLDEMKLGAIPAAVTHFPQLERLSLYNNEISDAGPLAGLTNLKLLDLRNNNIAVLPPQLLNLDIEFDVVDKAGVGNKLTLSVFKKKKT